MISSIHRQWLNQRMLIADQIVNCFGGKAEADAEILLCCALGALAAAIWPGDRIDRKRFVQLLNEFPASSASTARISICALIWQLENDSQQEVADKLIDGFFSSRLAYYGKSPHEYGRNGSGLHASTLPNIIYPDVVDTNEENIRRVEPRTSTKNIRCASYANIIYTDLRNGLVHEYELGENLTGSGWRQNNDRLNYVNYNVEPEQCKVRATAQEVGVTLDEALDGLTKVRRRLYFPYAFIRRLTQETAESVFNSWDAVGVFPRPQPAPWWIEGS